MIGKDGEFDIQDKDGEVVFSEKVTKNLPMKDRGYMNLLFLPWESIF